MLSTILFGSLFPVGPCTLAGYKPTGTQTYLASTQTCKNLKSTKCRCVAHELGEWFALESWKQALNSLRTETQLSAVLGLPQLCGVLSQQQALARCADGLSSCRQELRSFRQAPV